MAVSVIKRPQGHILGAAAVNCTILSSAGSVSFYNLSHGLSTGDYVYISSETSQYNGFWYVEIGSANQFWIREYATASRVAFITTFSATAVYYEAISTHGFSCVHLPIIYKLTNTAWPTNSIDTARAETGTVDNNGFCEITVAGDIKTTGTANVLDYIEVQTGALAGVYQIIEYTSDTVFTLNIPYSAANDTALSGATLQYYYNNYTVRVRIFAGLANHTYTDLKPYIEIADLSLKPDSNNLIEVNINEFLKERIKVISNDLTLATLPNDLDSFCKFYITIAETFDTTDGSTITTSTPSFAPDSEIFQGVAVNSKLQFKNRHSGYLSEYIAHAAAGSLSPMKFLTLFTEPRYFIGSYFDISFIIPDATAYIINLATYKNGVLQASQNTNIHQFSLGVYRFPISLPAGSLEDRIDVTLALADGGVTYSEIKTINVDSECSFQDLYLTWKNYLGGMDYWKFTAQKDYVTDIEGTTETSENLIPSWPNSYGEFADTIDKETSRTSRDKIVVRSQNMSESEMNAVRYIVSSPLVQIMVSKNDRRTVKVSTGSFTWKRDEDKLYAIEFEISYTNTIPSQSL